MHQSRLEAEAAWESDCIARRLFVLDNLTCALLEWIAVLEEHPDAVSNEEFYDIERYLSDLVEEERALLLELAMSEEEEYDEMVQEACAHPVADSYWED
jgi:hypothetical protein